MTEITFDTLRVSAVARHRIPVRGRLRDVGQWRGWLQPVLQDDDAMLCVVSTAEASEIRRMTAQDAVELFPNGSPVLCDPLDLRNRQVVASRDGHNGIAEAALLAAAFELELSFGYRKRGHEPDDRLVLITWADGARFGGTDRHRGDAPRSFRLERVVDAKIADRSLFAPVWADGTYLRGMRR